MRTGITMNAKAVLKLAIPLALAFALPGCVSFGGGKAPDTLITLTAAASAPAGAALSGKADGA